MIEYQERYCFQLVSSVIYIKIVTIIDKYILSKRIQEVSSISRQNLDENLETLHLAPTIYYLLLGFYPKQDF